MFHSNVHVLGGGDAEQLPLQPMVPLAVWPHVLGADVHALP